MEGLAGQGGCHRQLRNIFLIHENGGVIAAAHPKEAQSQSRLSCLGCLFKKISVVMVCFLRNIPLLPSFNRDSIMLIVQPRSREEPLSFVADTPFRLAFAPCTSTHIWPSGSQKTYWHLLISIHICTRWILTYIWDHMGLYYVYIYNIVNVHLDHYIPIHIDTHILWCITV